MVVCHDKHNSVEYLIVQACLRRQPIQRVPRAFKLVASQFAIYNSKIDTHRSVPYAHFLNDPRIGIVFVLAL